MTRSIPLALLAAAFALALASPALAQSQRAHERANPHAAFKRLDLNHDGRVSQWEIDRIRDQGLDRHWGRDRLPRHVRHPRHWHDCMAPRPLRIDRDGNSRISPAERARALRLARLDRRSARCDGIRAVPVERRRFHKSRSGRRGAHGH